MKIQNNTFHEKEAYRTENMLLNAVSVQRSVSSKLQREYNARRATEVFIEKLVISTAAKEWIQWRHP